MSRLTITENDRSLVHEILEDEILVGRRAGATIRLSDSDAGEEHCKIRAVPGLGYKLIDLESRAGTRVNGAYVNQQLLRDGDVIEIGSVRIAFALEGGGPPAVQPPPLPAAAAPVVQAAATATGLPARAPARPPAWWTP